MEVSLGKYICCVGWAVVRGSDAENYEKRAILKEKNRKTGRGDCCASPPEPQCCLAHLQCKPEHPQGCCGVSQGMTVMLQGLVAARAETFLLPQPPSSSSGGRYVLGCLLLCCTEANPLLGTVTARSGKCQ